jgi:ubiquinone/menaquinone biosynthesis C-methylase UbiE
MHYLSIVNDYLSRFSIFPELTSDRELFQTFGKLSNLGRLFWLLRRAIPMERPPNWQLPAGVTPAVWQYVHSREAAADYDLQLEGSLLFQADEAFVLRHCNAPGRLIDLGCGTGRIAKACSQQGHWVLGVDLSTEMLKQAMRRREREGLRVEFVKGNLADLRFIADQSFDYAVCLFSTLGMIHGQANRQRVVLETHRLLRPGGKFVLHIHNWWFNLWDPAGRRWVVADTWRKLAGDPAAGDRPMPPHQGLAGLALHHFTLREVRTLLRQTGFAVHEIQSVGLAKSGRLQSPRFLGWLRAYGYLLAAVKR